MYRLSFKPSGFYGGHDGSAVIFEDDTILFGAEEERYDREKHTTAFPENAIRACLEYADCSLSDVDEILIPYYPPNYLKNLDRTVSRKKNQIRRQLSPGNSAHPLVRVYRTLRTPLELSKYVLKHKYFYETGIENRLSDIGTPVPDVRFLEHHACHAASAFYPTDFDEAVVVTMDGSGEHDATVVWHGSRDGVERVRTYEVPNSIGHLWSSVTEYLGFRANNGEGKVMGLAPYGRPNEEIETRLRSELDFGLDYDVSPVGEAYSRGEQIAFFEDLFGEERVATTERFDQFYKDLAFAIQQLTEETVQEITRHYVGELGSTNVCLSGGVALNCKMNKTIREMDCVDDVFVQPVSSDAGLPLGACWLNFDPTEIDPMDRVYWGPEPFRDGEQLLETLEKNKLTYRQPEDTERYVAEKLADGAITGWVQGRMEMGPRALGNRSILADPRSTESRDRVNKYVKHREEWRPFAPSLLETAADDYLEDAEAAPYMIQTFDTKPDRRDEIEAVVHPEDDSTRPQTVRKEQNERYHRLISEFEDITGVPVLLNTSFNDHGEPIIVDAKQAIQDFYVMGLDVLAIGNIVIEK